MNASRHTRQGFTLIEILAAMAVLSLIVLVLGGLFDQSTKAWTTGEKKVVTADLARSVLDELHRDVAASITDEIVPFAINNNWAVIGGALTSSFPASEKIGASDAIRLLSIVSPRSAGTSGQTDLHDITYYLETSSDGRGTLRRRASNIRSVPRKGLIEYAAGGTGNLDTYSELFGQPFFITPDSDTDVIMDNVYSFQVTALDPAAGFSPILDYYSKDAANANMQPGRIDVRIVALTDDQWARMDTLDGGDWHDWVATNGNLFVTSVATPTRGR